MATITDKALVKKCLLEDMYDESTNLVSDRMCRICRARVNPMEKVLMYHLEKVHPKEVASYNSYGKAHVNAKFVLCFFLQTNGSEKSKCILCERVYDRSNDLMMENHLRFAHSMEDRQIIAGPTEEEYNLFGLTRNNMKFTPVAKNINVWQIGSKRPAPQQDVTVKAEPNGTLPIANSNDGLSLSSFSPEEVKANAAVVLTCFQKIVGDGLRCNYCNRVFRNKQDHILIAHMGAAHPQVQLKDPDIDRSVSPINDHMKADISIYFTRTHNRWQCIICKLMFGNSKHCASHMSLKHADVLVQSKKNEKNNKENNAKRIKLENDVQSSETSKSDETRQLSRQEKLKALRFNPYNMSTVTKVTYDASDPNNMTCDFFEAVDDTMQCIICDLLIKTTNVNHLLKHLRMHHSIYHADDKKFIISDAVTKRFKTSKIDMNGTIDGDLYATYDNPSIVETEPDYVWNFFDDHRGKLTCICCGQHFAKKTFNSLMKHLQLIHPKVFPGAIEEEQFQTMDAQKPQPLYQYRKGKPLKSERSMTSFMINQGIPHDGIFDPNFTHIQHCMSKMASINTPAALDTVVEELDSDFRRCFLVSVTGPVTATVDFHIESGDIYLVFALHHFEADTQRRNHVFIKKMFGTRMNSNAIQHSIAETMSLYNYGTTQISNFVFHKQYDEIFRDCGVKTYYCFYSIMSAFAEDIVKLPRFTTPVLRLFSFLDQVRNDPVLVTRFDLIQKGFGSKLDLFQSRGNLCWTRLMEYLKILVVDEKNLSLLNIFARRWKVEGWIDATNIKYIILFCHVLRKISECANKISSPDGTASSVIPLVVGMMKNFKETLPDEVLIKELDSFYAKHFHQLFTGACESRYEIAMFFDPRYVSLQTIYDEAKWQTVTEKVKDLLLKETDIERELGEEDVDTQITQSLVQLNKEISKEITGYIGTAIKDRPNFENSSPLIWWTTYKGSYPILFQKALEFFSVPMCTMSADNYFGNNGKLARFKNVMSYQQLSKILQVVARSETFKGPGFIETRQTKEVTPEPVSAPLSTSPMQRLPAETPKDGPPPMPKRIASLACARPKATDTEFVPKLTKYEQKKQMNLENLKPTRFIQNDEDNYLEDMLMCPPPPVLEPMVEVQQSPEDSIVKEETPSTSDIREVKLEVEDPEFEISEASNPLTEYVKKEEPDF